MKKFLLVGVLALAAVAAWFAMPVISPTGLSRRTQALSNLKQVTTGFLIYADDNDGVLPPVRGWSDRLMPYLKNEGFLVTELDDGREVCTAMNAGSARLDLDLVAEPERGVLDFLAPGTARNTFGGPGGVFLDRYAHATLGFLDGHAKWHTKDEAGTFEWAPEEQPVK